MSVLTATAIISAVDNASAVFARVAASARAAAGRFGSATAAADRYSGTLTTALGASAAFGTAFALRGEYEIDKLARLTQSAGELTGLQRRMLEDSAFSASLATGIAATEVIKGQQALIQGGVDVETAAKLSRMFSMISRANNITNEKAAEDAINVARAMGFAMETTEDRIASLVKAMEFMSVVPNLSTETWDGLRTSLKYAAPVAGALGIEISKLGAALSILADAGFKGEEGGTAFRTIMTRALAPTRAARLELRAAGISLEDIYTFEEATAGLGDKIGNMVSLAERLRAAGLGQDVDLAKMLAPFGDPAQFKNLYAMQDALQNALMKGLGIGKGDAESRGILMKAIQNHFRAATSGFDIEKFFKGISNLSIPAMKEMFGLQRISQAIALKNELNKIMELPSGERINRFQQLAREFERLMPGSIERRFGPVSEGFAFTVDRMAASLANLRSSIFRAGVGDVAVGWLGSLATSVENLAKQDPERLKAIGYGIAGIAGLGVGTVGLGAVAGSLTAISTALSTPVMGKLLMGGGLAAILGADFGSLFAGIDRLDARDLPVYSFMGAGAPIVQTFTALRDLFTEISGLAGSVGDVGKELAGLVGLNVEGSLLVNGLRVVNSLLQMMGQGARALREDLDWLTGKGRTGPGMGGALGGAYKPLDDMTGGAAGGFLGMLWDGFKKQMIDNGRTIMGAPGTRSMVPAPDFGPAPSIDRLGAFARQPVTVTGDAKVQVDNTVTIKIDGPGVVTDNRPGSATATVPLNTGRGMSDAGSVP